MYVRFIKFFFFFLFRMSEDINLTVNHVLFGLEIAMSQW